MEPLKRILAVGIICGFLLAIIHSDQPVRAAGPWYVTPSGSDANTCTSPAAACATINGALAKVGFVSGDTIRVAQGAYTGSGAQVVLVDDHAVLSGGWNADFTTQTGHSTLDGQAARRGLVVADNLFAVVDRFIIRNGVAPDSQSGGGIFNQGNLTLNNSMVESNQDTGIRNGYFVYNPNIEPPTIEQPRTLTLNNSLVINNDGGSFDGGGIISRGTLTVNQSAVIGNRANYGAGIYFLGNLALNNTTISGNTATYSGGGIAALFSANYPSGNSLQISNATITGNQARDGGGLSSWYINVQPIMTLKNSILTGNTATNSGPNCYLGTPPLTMTSGGYNLTGSMAGCTYVAGTGDLTGMDAKLGSLIGKPGTPPYHPLFSGSPAIDAGDPAGCTGSGGALITDQRGASRSGRCDIGAYEAHAPGPAALIYITGGSGQHAGPDQQFTLTLDTAVLDSIGSPVGAANIAFTAPDTGPSAVFADSGTPQTSAATNENGLAQSALLTANDQPGKFSVNAQVEGTTVSTAFELSIGDWYISTAGSDSNSCHTPDSPCATLQAVFGRPDLTDGAKVYIAAGRYTGTAAEVLRLSRSAILLGGWDEGFIEQTGFSVLDGENTRRGMVVQAGIDVTVERFMIENGRAAGSSSASRSGGGIFSDGRLILRQAVIRNNTANLDGGGIFSTGALTLDQAAVLNNRAFRGGGINGVANITITNSTIEGNFANGLAGGVMAGDNLRIYSSTIFDNEVYTYMSLGGGIYARSAHLENTIVFGNRSDINPNCSIDFSSSGGHNLIGEPAGCRTQDRSGDMVNTDPLLGALLTPPGVPSYRPLNAASPAINAGSPGGCSGKDGPLTVDQRRAPRQAACDIGAYEYHAPGAAAAMFYHSGDGQRTAPLRDYALPLKTIVLDEIGSPVPGATVSFHAPTSGPSVLFAGAASTNASVETDENGIATSPFLNANAQKGAFTVTADSPAIADVVTFHLENISWHVAVGGSDNNPCDTAAQPCATVPGVLNKPGFMPGDTVKMTAEAHPAISLTKDVVISGGWNSAFTTQSGYTSIGRAEEAAAVASFDANSQVVTAERLAIIGAKKYGIRSLKQLTLISSVVRKSGDMSGEVGGMLIDGRLRLVNVTLTQNTYSGLVLIFDPHVEIYNSTITDPMGFQGGSDDSRITAQNSIFADQTPSASAPSCWMKIASLGYNLFENPGCVETAGPGDLLGVDAGFRTFAPSANMFVLDPDSPAINAGNPAGCTGAYGERLAVDQRGLPRTGRCDIGAYEFSPFFSSSITADQETLTAGDTLTIKLTIRHQEAEDISQASAAHQVPKWLAYVPGSLQATSGQAVYNSGGLIQWSGTVQTGVPVEVTYQAMVGTVKGPAVAELLVQWAGHSYRDLLVFKGDICRVTYSASNPVLPRGGSGAWDRDDVSDPVLVKENSGYKLYYTGVNNSVSAIGLATSTDGVVFTKIGAVLSPSYLYEHSFRLGSVLKDGSTYKMWFSFTIVNISYIGYATSTDGVNWTRVKTIDPRGFVWTSGGIYWPRVYKNGELYHMWFSAYVFGGTRLGHATSPDGLTWELESEPILRLGEVNAWDWLGLYAPSFVRLDDYYELWYAGASLPTQRHLGVATSSNCLNWTRRASPVVRQGVNPYDAAGIGPSWVEADSSGYRIWYTGVDANGKSQISLAVSEVCTLSSELPPQAGNQRTYLPLVTGTGTFLTYMDNFSNPGSGWPVGNGMSYTGGAYQLTLKGINASAVLASTGIQGKNYTVEITATPQSGNGAYGIFFNRYFESSLEFVLWGDMYALRSTYSGEPPTMLRNWTASPAIHANGPNRLKMKLEADILSMYVNDILLDTVNLARDFSTSWEMEFRALGLILYKAGDPTVLFDDFRFTPLGQYDQEDFDH